MIVGGRLVTPDGVRSGQIQIEQGRIIACGVQLGTADEQFDEDCLIFPGFGDIHIHARDDASGKERYKEDFCTAGAAARNGGVVHVADMPNNHVAPVDDATYELKLARLKECAPPVHFTLYAGIGPGTRPLSRSVPYKAYMGPSVGHLFFRSLADLDETLAHYRGLNVSFHCEDPILLDQHRDAPTHEQRRPPECELSATEFALRMIEKYDLTGKLCHFSVGQGLPKIVAGRKKGLRVTTEVTPHHLFFDTTQLTEQNRGWMQMNPPLRSPADRTALVEALRDGTLDYLATDHAPHTLAENEKGISGQPHLDTYGPFVTWLMAEHRFTPEQILRCCSLNPGLFVNPFLTDRRYGKLEAGYTASLTVLNLRRPITIERGQLATKCGWSPFEGFTFPGSVEAVFLDGMRYPPRI